jgi:hypothetical protein
MPTASSRAGDRASAPANAAVPARARHAASGAPTALRNALRRDGPSVARPGWGRFAAVERTATGRHRRRRLPAVHVA